MCLAQVHHELASFSARTPIPRSEELQAAKRTYDCRPAVTVTVQRRTCTNQTPKKKTAWPATPDPSLAAGPHLSCSSLLPPRGSHAAVWDVASEFSIEPSKLSVFANSFVVLVRLAFSRDRRNTQHTSASNGISQTNNRIFRGSIR
jgi:hypothetical protein